METAIGIQLDLESGHNLRTRTGDALLSVYQCACVCVSACACVSVCAELTAEKGDAWVETVQNPSLFLRKADSFFFQWKVRIRREGNFHCSCCCFCCCWCSWRILLFVFSSILSFPSHLSPSLAQTFTFSTGRKLGGAFFSSLHFFRVLSFNNSSFLQLVWSWEAMKREGSFRAYRLPITAVITPTHPSCSESGTFQPLLHPAFHQRLRSICTRGGRRRGSYM